MKKLNFFTGGHPLRLDDLNHLQDGIIDAIKGVVNGLGANNQNLILQGCVVSGVSPQVISAGYIYFNGEVYPVDSQTLPFLAFGESYYFQVEELTVSPSPVTYQDTVAKDVHVRRRMKVVNASVAPVNSFLINSAVRLNQILGATPQRGIIMYSGPITNFETSGKGKPNTQLDGWALCLSGDTEVLLADYTTKTIKEIVDNKLEVEVLSYDILTKTFLPKKITNWYRNESSIDDFSHLKLKNLGTKGKRVLNATKDHPVYTKDGYVKVEDLNGRKIYKLGKSLTVEGQQALLGMYLGDGSCDHRYVFGTSHGERQKGYLSFVAKKLGKPVVKFSQSSGYGAGKVGYLTRIALKSIGQEILHLLKKPKVKKETLEKLGDIGLAFWYMDDGQYCFDKNPKGEIYKNSHRAVLHTQGFDINELTEIISFFESKFNCKVVKYKSPQCIKPDSYFIKLDESGSRQFFKLIAPYIHKDLLYKLPESFQNCENKLNSLEFVKTDLVEVDYKQTDVNKLSRQTIKKTDYSVRYDIQVEDTHCFFANGILVHNCNGGTFTVPGGGTITVPDLRGKFVVGYDNRSIDPSNSVWDASYNTIDGNSIPNGTGGEKEHVLTKDELPPHEHGLSPDWIAVAGMYPSGTGAPQGRPSIASGTDASITVGGFSEYPLSSTHLSEDGTIDGLVSNPHENRPPYFTVCYIMKLL